MDTTEFDVQDHLKTEEDFRLFLEASFAEDPGDGSGIRLALREIAKARGVYSVAKESGITPQGIYKSLGENGNPSFETIMRIMRSLGYAMTPVHL
ncbi:MAG: putative addiction module antidote protein [Alistipes senegalensis]|nr:putative addiction module antidote protein [Oxalobacter formigenes]MCM1280943.1 putative addiction module antidote protein [Alistipes senegalensis]